MIVRRIMRRDDPALSAIARIYESSIPTSERKPTEWIGHAVERADFAVLVAEARGIAVGFATVFAPTESAALLEYLAVDRDRRGMGVGSLLFDAVVKTAGAQPLLIEVDSPTNSISRQRIAFYQRCGCTLIEGVNYILPLPTNPPVMRLMRFPAKAKVTPGWLRQSLEHIYTRVYSQALGDPRIDQMINGFSFVD